VIEIVDAAKRVARSTKASRPPGARNHVNGRDQRGVPVASGVYFYRLLGMPDVPSRKMVLLK
jgi:hypothetical protein